MGCMQYAVLSINKGANNICVCITLRRLRERMHRLLVTLAVEWGAKDSKWGGGAFAVYLFWVN